MTGSNQYVTTSGGVVLVATVTKHYSGRNGQASYSTCKTNINGPAALNFTNALTPESRRKTNVAKIPESRFRRVHCSSEDCLEEKHSQRQNI